MFHQKFSKMTSGQKSLHAKKYETFMNTIKSKTGLGIIKFFSLQTAHTFSQRLFSSNN